MLGKEKKGKERKVCYVISHQVALVVVCIN